MNFSYFQKSKCVTWRLNNSQLLSKFSGRCQPSKISVHDENTILLSNRPPFETELLLLKTVLQSPLFVHLGLLHHHLGTVRRGKTCIVGIANHQTVQFHVLGVQCFWHRDDTQMWTDLARVLAQVERRFREGYRTHNGEGPQAHSFAGFLRILLLFDSWSVIGEFWWLISYRSLHLFICFSRRTPYSSCRS